MKALVIVEHDENTVKMSTLSVVTAAKLLGDECVCLVVSDPQQTVAKQCAAIAGVSAVWRVDDSEPDDLCAQNLAAIITACATEFTHILAPATTFGKDVLPRVAALLDVAQISDIIAVQGSDRFVRPIYAGNAVATVQALDPIKVITVRPTAFAKSAVHQGQPAPIVARQRPPVMPTKGRMHVLKRETSESTRPELGQARVVVAGGRGLQNKDNFKLIDELADCLGAAVGASRAAVDAGFVPNDYQVGQTGKVVAPELYMAIGISGAIQHVAGMKESKIVVAINKDPDAPIFQVADYGLVADLFQAVPQLIAALRKRQQ
jgi:electron transfer flavoprotein alpha subunit